MYHGINSFLFVICSSIMGLFLTAELSGKIDAFLRRAHRYGLAANILTLNCLIVLRRIFQQNPIAIILCYLRRKPRV